MTDKIFGSTYANFYDIFYHDKNYEKECDCLEQIFGQFSKKKIKSILDLGCGTGNHALPLAQRGYSVTGVDISESMLRQAHKKSSLNDGKVEFIRGDIRHVRLKKKYDSAIMMFAVLGYQLNNSDVLKTLQTVRQHLSSGGLFIFDVWYGPAVLYTKPSQRTKTIPLKNGEKIVRKASADINVIDQICSVNYKLHQVRNNKTINRIKEQHTMRFFFPLELQMALEFSDFQLLHLGAFSQYKRQPTEKDWNIVAVAKAV